MSEPKANEKKMVGRSVAVALGIICIVLVASLAGTISVLNNANQQNRNLQSQLDNFGGIINMTKSEIFIDNENLSVPEQNAASGQLFWSFHVDYSGLLKIEVKPPSPDIVASLAYNSGPVGYSFNHKYSLDAYETESIALFEVVTSPSYYNVPETGYLHIDIWNNSTEPILGNVTITYYY